MCFVCVRSKEKVGTCMHLFGVVFFVFVVFFLLLCGLSIVKIIKIDIKKKKVGQIMKKLTSKNKAEQIMTSREKKKRAKRKRYNCMSSCKR